MDNDNFSFLADAESSITGDKTEGYTPKEQELIHQLVQERLGKKNAIEFESLDSKYEHKGIEFGEDADFSPYYGPGIIAIDACTAFSGKVNCLVIED